MWKSKCIGKFEIQKFLFYKHLKLTILTESKIEAKHYDHNTTYTIN